jgi:hypothetical protein
MVLTRMETHPDDFYDNDQLVRHSSPRFGWVWNAINGSGSYGLNGAEIDALKQGYDKVMYRKFHDRVLESMLNDPKQDEMLKRQGSSLKYKPGLTDPRGIYGSAIAATQAEMARQQAIQAHNIATLSANTSISNILTADSVKVGKQTLTEALVQKLKNL